MRASMPTTASRSAKCARSRHADRGKLGVEIVLCPPSALKDLWLRRFPDPVTEFASGWMRTKARARQKGIELPLVISRPCRLAGAVPHNQGDGGQLKSG